MSLGFLINFLFSITSNLSLFVTDFIFFLYAFCALFLAFNFIAGFSSAINQDGLLAKAVFFSDLPKKI